MRRDDAVGGRIGEGLSRMWVLPARSRGRGADKEGAKYAPFAVEKGFESERGVSRRRSVRRARFERLGDSILRKDFGYETELSDEEPGQSGGGRCRRPRRKLVFGDLGMSDQEQARRQLDRVLEQGGQGQFGGCAEFVKVVGGPGVDVHVFAPLVMGGEGWKAAAR